MANIGDALLILKNRPVSGSPGAYRLTVGTNILQIGNDFGTAEGLLDNQSSRSAPRIVQFRGDNDLYAMLDGAIYKYDGASTWNSVHTLSGTPNGHIGLFVAHPAGVPTLVAMFHDGALNFTVNYSTDGSTWNTGATKNANSDAEGKHTAVQYRNKIFASNDRISGGTRIHEYDVENHVWSAEYTAGGGTTTPALHVYQNRLLALHDVTDTAGSQATTIFELIGGSFQVIKTLDFPRQESSAKRSGPVLFTDPSTGDLIAFVVNRHSDSGTYGTSVGAVVERLTPSGGTFTSTDLTATVLPASERPGGANGSRDMMWAAFRAADGSVHLWRWTDDNATTPTGFISYAPWNGVGTMIGEPAGTIQNLSPFANAEYIIPWNLQGGGEHIWTLDEATIQLEDVAAFEDAKKTLRFRVYGDGVATFSVRFQFSADEEFPDNFCTLIASTVTGGGSPTNTTAQVDGIVSDGSLYTVEWNIVTDGIATGSFYSLKAVEA
jgi:hypothetical protein